MTYSFQQYKTLPLFIQDKSYLVYGGSCYDTNIEGLNIYLSLDTEQPVYDWEQPWHPSYQQFDKKHIRFPVLDMFIPDNSHDFKACISYIAEQVLLDKKIHIGCIGGNGRTGLFLSALTQTLMGNTLNHYDADNAVEYVRKYYNPKAVETVSQLLFLKQVYGINFSLSDAKKVEQFSLHFEKEIGNSLDHMLSGADSIDQLFVVLKLVEESITYQTTSLKSKRQF